MFVTCIITCFCCAHGIAQLGKAEGQSVTVPLAFFFFLIPALAAKAHKYVVGDGFKFTEACKEVKDWCDSITLLQERPLHLLGSQASAVRPS